MKLSYRADIDGLRAVAILLVVFYHLQININNSILFRFGYIGVDIFFVISGYLIGRIIINSLNKKNFSFIKFYESRVRRLLPALLFTIIIFLPAGYLLLLPTDLIEFANSIIASIFFFSNFYFYESQIQYDPQNFSLIPFLNTWSLAVEEQFYIIFPLLFFLIFKFLKKYTILLFILIFISSLVLAEITFEYLSPSLNFYILPTRVWELFAGVLIAYFELRRTRFLNIKIIRTIGSYLGSIIIILSLFLFDENTKHPSLITLLPVIGTCLIIISNQNRNNLVKKLLSNKYLVFIGLVSYSLYLIHYPLIAFFKIYFSENLNLNLVFIALVLSFILSILSYKYIEKPFRDRKKTNIKKLSLFILFCGCISIFTSISFLSSNGYASRLPEIFSNKSHIFPRDMLEDEKGNCFHRTDEFCNFNDFKDKPKVVLIGDSIMGSLAYDLKIKLNDLKLNFKTMIIGGCFYLPDFEIKDHRCNLIAQKNMKKNLYNEGKNSIIIIGGDLTNNLYENEKKFISEKGITIEEGFIKSIQELLDSRYKVILLYPLPVFEENVSQKIFSSVRGSNYLIKKDVSELEEIIKDNSVELETDKYKIQSKKVYEIYDKLNHKNLIKVYPHKIFCDTYVKNKCAGNNEKNIFFHDKKHPSLYGSNLINNLIEKEIKNIVF